VLLGIRITFNGRRLGFDTELSGATERIGRRCWAAISDDLRLFAGRAGANLRELEIDLPTSAVLVADAQAYADAGHTPESTSGGGHAARNASMVA
jgi:hypothetical protein